MSTTWGRWEWTDTGLGRWHAIADEGVGLIETPRGPVMAMLVKTACARLRIPPSQTDPNPERENRCPECEALDGLRERREVERINDSLDAAVRAGVPMQFAIADAMRRGRSETP